MAVRTDFAAGEVLAAQDLDDTFASKPRKTTASTAPSSPATGDLWFDTTTSPAIAKFWDGSAWQTFSAGAANFSNTATGTYSSGGVDYKYISFTSSGTLTVTKAGFADILVVGGGGGGGKHHGGGGGGGGMFFATGFYLPVGSLAVTVGAGGAGGTTTLQAYGGRAGGASNIGNLFAIGGGGGGSRDVGGAGPDGNGGGSGGGAGGANTASSAIGGAAMIASQGFNGSTNGDQVGGQGGSSAGVGAVSTAVRAGASNSITNTAVVYANGGGGGTGATQGATGTTPGSGGGGNNGTAPTGSAGLDGIVIVRVKV